MDNGGDKRPEPLSLFIADQIVTSLWFKDGVEQELFESIGPRALQTDQSLKRTTHEIIVAMVPPGPCLVGRSK